MGGWLRHRPGGVALTAGAVTQECTQIGGNGPSGPFWGICVHCCDASRDASCARWHECLNRHGVSAAPPRLVGKTCSARRRATHQATDTKVDYLERRAQTGEWCVGAINDHLVVNGPSTRAEIIEILSPHLPASLTPKQREDKADNLLRKMRSQGGIRSRLIGGRRAWEVT